MPPKKQTLPTVKSLKNPRDRPGSNAEPVEGHNVQLRKMRSRSKQKGQETVQTEDGEVPPSKSDAELQEQDSKSNPKKSLRTLENALKMTVNHTTNEGDLDFEDIDREIEEELEKTKEVDFESQKSSLKAIENAIKFTSTTHKIVEDDSGSKLTSLKSIDNAIKFTKKPMIGTENVEGQSPENGGTTSTSIPMIVTTHEDENEHGEDREVRFFAHNPTRD